jgi:hypothetical protein
MVVPAPLNEMFGFVVVDCSLLTIGHSIHYNTKYTNKDVKY